MEVVARLVELVKGRDAPLTVFDYGCGSGGDWPRILAEVDGFEVVGYEPNERYAAEARRRLDGTATILSGDSLDGLDLAADVIVSFSVFEHVYDRRAYLATAKRLLAPDGTFYLNYDDGHFRIRLELDRPGKWLEHGRVAAHNAIAPTLARIGRIATYQRRVARADADAMVAEAGFTCGEVFYSNLGDAKGLYRTIPEDRRDEFCQAWVDFERRLNERSLVEMAAADRGDTANLWSVMPSRTLVLTHADHA
jgi:SAM-dependent methyltransferase